MFDYWEPHEAWHLLAGFAPKKMLGALRESNLLDYDSWVSLYFDADTDKERESLNISFQSLVNEVQRVEDFWTSSDLGSERRSPSFIIKWSISKGLTPEWLDWAIQKKLYVPNESLNQKLAPWSDEKNPNYAVELDIAVKAWIAVTSSPEKGKPKFRIRKWLDANYTDKELSKEAKTRISTVVNWDKSGGAPRTE